MTALCPPDWAHEDLIECERGPVRGYIVPSQWYLLPTPIVLPQCHGPSMIVHAFRPCAHQPPLRCEPRP